jgi:hypothetical protein
MMGENLKIVLQAIAMFVFWFGALAFVPVLLVYGVTYAMYVLGSVIVAGIVLLMD